MLGTLVRPPREVARQELLDHGNASPEDLAGNLASIARLNRIGPIHSLLIYLAPFLDRHRGPEPLTVLDIGTGAADIPAAVVRWARARGRRVTVFGMDAQPDILAIARARTLAFREVRLLAGEALSAPIRPLGVDVTICSLMLHHLPEAAVIGVIRLMAEVSRQGFLVSDLRRSWAAWAAAWVLTRVTSRSRMARHDGPLSVRRAYTRAELVRLTETAGVPGVVWRHAIAFRVIGLYERGRAPG